MDWMRFIGRRRPLPRTVHDVIRRPRQQVVRLRERAWIVEISASSLARTLARHRVRSSVAALLVVALLVGLLHGVGRANVATLYATSCLGGWANPQQAEGEPEVPPGSDAELFTSKNSASLDGALAQLYCGGFRGEVPLDASPRKVLLSFSWAVVGVETQGVASQRDIPAALGEVPVRVDVDATPEQQVEALLEAPEEAQAVQVQDPPSAEPAPVEPLPVPEVAPEPSAEVSWRPFVPVARAQDEVAAEAPSAEVSSDVPAESTVGAQNFAPLPPVPESKVVDDVPAAPDLVPAPEEPRIVPADEPPVEPTSVETQNFASLPTDTEPPFLEISYTLDGKTWATVAKVTTQSWAGLAVELPLASWDELATVQVMLQAVPTAAEQPLVLLDSIYLAVTYGTDAADVQEQPDFSRDTIVQLLADGPYRLIRTFSASRQRQQLWAYQASGEGSWTLVAEEPELDPVAASVLDGSSVVWVAAGGATLNIYEITSQTYSSAAFDRVAAVAAELPVRVGSFARWAGGRISLADDRGAAQQPTGVALDRGAFLSSLRGAAAVAAPASAATDEATVPDKAAATTVESIPAEAQYITPLQSEPSPSAEIFDPQYDSLP